MLKRNWLESLTNPRLQLRDEIDGEGDPVADAAGDEPVIEPGDGDEPVAEPGTDPVSLLGFAKRGGIDSFDDGTDDETVANQLIERYQQASELEQQNAAIQQERDALRLQLAQQATHFAQQPPVLPAPPQGAAPADEPKEWNAYDPDGAWAHWANRPEWDPAMERFLHKNEEGQIVGLPGARAGLAEEYHAHNAWLQQANEAIVTDPASFFRHYTLPTHEIERRIEEKFNERFNAIQEQQNVQMMVGELDQFVFERDESGNVRTDPTTGQALISEQGHAFEQEMAFLEAQGITDPAQAIPIARRSIASRFAEAPAAAPVEDPAPAPGAANLEFQRQAAKRTANGGRARGRKRTRPTSEDSPASAIDVAEELRSGLEAVGQA